MSKIGLAKQVLARKEFWATDLSFPDSKLLTCSSSCGAIAASSAVAPNPRPVTRIKSVDGRHNTRYCLENKTFPTNQALLRFHHQLTRIHPFANGNGRHARMIADVVAVKYGHAEFTWGAGKNPVAQGDARSRYLAALRALDENENDLKPLLDFARS